MDNNNNYKLYIIIVIVFIIVFYITDPVVRKVRLSGGDTTFDNRGIVEYYTSSTWHTICPDFWTDSDANIVCISLGYESGSSAIYTVNTM